MVVGFAAGQAIDILARLIAQSLAEQLSQQFIVENKPGAGGAVAKPSLSRARRQTATRLLVIGANNPINTTLYDKLGFDLLRDFAPVAASTAYTRSWRSIPPFRRGPSPNSSPTPRPIREKSTSAPPAPVRWRTSRASGSR
jgi:hypothetical protein